MAAPLDRTSCPLPFEKIYPDITYIYWPFRLPFLCSLHSIQYVSIYAILYERNRVSTQSRVLSYFILILFRTNENFFSFPIFKI